MKNPFHLTLLLMLVIFAGAPAAVLGQPTSEASAVTNSLSGLHNITKAHILQTAEMLDDDIDAYRPADGVRTTGELLAHIAGSQFAFCSAAGGSENPSPVNYEETATTKADIIAALKTSFEYCDGVYGGMTDEAGAVVRPLFGGMEMAGSAILAFNSAHNYEHYGNLVTYMRMNGIVPPSSM